MGNNRIQTVATPSATTDATNKAYVDGLASNYATAAQGATADSALQAEVDTLETVTNRGATTVNTVTVGSLLVEGLTITDNNITGSRSNDDIILDPAGVGTVDINSNRIRVSNSKTPASALGAAGDQEGDIAWDTNYIYVCTANYNGSTNVWKRVAISTWA
jgi:hypothetical protein